MIARRDAATDELGRAEVDGISQRMRTAWKEWNGGDELHEMAFGEPAE